MDLLETVLFFLLCLGVPIAMISILVVRAVRAVRDRKAARRRVADEGWAAVGEGARDALQAQIEGAGLSFARASLRDALEREGVVVARYVRPPRGSGPSRGGGARRWLLIVPRPEPGPRGVIQRRPGGVLGAAAEALADALGGTREIPGWEWALVGPAGSEWLDDALSPLLERFLEPGERLRFGEEVVALGLSVESQADALAAASERADGLRRLLAL
ncbi:MAG TPA: hypothetical protein RMH85_28175 [Polyangiaceae bacterium LLY-WYZ-15_(1-7)]|nr:hypothetical protein [Polyangiaceae bacterium LLY-WYZ-15_(1-7)]